MKRNWWRGVSLVVFLIASIWLQKYIGYWQSFFCLFCVGISSYLDGLYRGGNENNK